jgi:hypothetical protein
MANNPLEPSVTHHQERALWVLLNGTPVAR